ncbi:RTFDC1 [Cordylochernes scorpioides]|uniref:Replication termination factor 2 n=1 Tax=Cordylochernes scorpioides TaxID=51811 RepID=A0ABY6KPA2_9ARAC|nr:RTFDC1 [Cordylochernes scorpioides]
MGCDGGTIPRRDELVKTKQKPEQKDKNAEAVARWRHCALTQQELKQPIVTCELGRLYNKESILEFLLSKEKNQEVVKHIRNLKDVKALKLTTNPNFQNKQADKGDQYVDHQTSPYICPIIGLEMNGNYKFNCIWKCGCVLSERALKEIKSETCTICNSPFEKSDIITLNPNEEDRERMEKQMKERREKNKLAKKSKKQKAEETVVNGNAKKMKLEEPSTSNGKTSTKNLDDKPSQKNDSKINLSTKIIIPEKAKADYSVAKDPKASETLKSLFTTHHTAKVKVKQHWVTHNNLFY